MPPITRSPSRTLFTPAPTAATTPIHSCPQTAGLESAPDCQACRSVPQTPQ